MGDGAEERELTLRLPHQTCAELQSRAYLYDMRLEDMLALIASIAAGPWLDATDCPLCAIRERARESE
jgi:hypothetical protein